MKYTFQVFTFEQFCSDTLQNIILDTPRKRDEGGVSFFNHFL